MRRCRLLLGVVVVAMWASDAHAGSPHVRHLGTSAAIVDGSDHELLLRGVNVNALVDYNTDYREAVPLSSGDFREIAALGLNFVRLAVSWSGIEPAPGRFSASYLNRIVRWVKIAERNGMRVLVDFHQDRYNRHLWAGNEVDGAPDWATQTDGLPCTEVGGVTTLCAQAAEQHFWQNDTVAGGRLQDQFLQALLVVSRRLRQDSSLLGFELWNEPTPGYVQSPAFEHSQLWPFYQRMIAGLRADRERRMIWFEPTVLRDLTDQDPSAARFSDDPNLVYAPHIYTDVFTPPGHPTDQTAQRLRASYLAAISEARAYGTVWVDDEWGGGAGGDWESYRTENLDLQDQLLVGSALWMWKQKAGFYNWQVVDQNGDLRRDSLKAQQLARPHVDAVPGSLLSTQLAASGLAAQLRGSGGIAQLWSGVRIDRGGLSPFPVLTRVMVDGRSVKAALRSRCYRNAHTILGGFLVSVRIPPGDHRITLTTSHQRLDPCQPQRKHRGSGYAPRKPPP